MATSEHQLSSEAKQPAQSISQDQTKSINPEELHDEFMSESVIRSDELDHEIIDAIIIRASEQVSATILKQRAKEREEAQKRRMLWQEERRTFNQYNGQYMETAVKNQARIIEELKCRFPKPQETFISKLWLVTSEFLKSAALVSVIWYCWKSQDKIR
jgi:maltodextrin utilization protein YvdJ